jgi:uncharacterized membrane-anchored protein
MKPTNDFNNRNDSGYELGKAVLIGGIIGGSILLGA